MQLKRIIQNLNKAIPHFFLKFPSKFDNYDIHKVTSFDSRANISTRERQYAWVQINLLLDNCRLYCAHWHVQISQEYTV